MDLHDEVSKTLPNGWVWTRLGEVVEILDNKRIPVNTDEREKRISGKSPSELIPYYGATGQVGWIDDYIFDEELVLLGEDGAPFFEPTKNKAYIIRGKSWVNNHAHVLRGINGVILNSFICHYLNIFDYHGYVTGTTRLKLNQSSMQQIPIPLPPLNEQKRIVAKIEELFTRLEAGVEALKKVKAQIRRYRQAVLKYAFEGKLTNSSSCHSEQRSGEGISEIVTQPSVANNDLPELPEGWRWVKLGEAAEIIMGQSPPSKTYNTVRIGLPFYQGKAEFGLIYPIPSKWCSKPKKIAEKNDILLSIRAPVGPTNICFETSCIGRGLAAIRFGGLYKFLFYYLRNVEREISKIGTGSTFSAISKSQISNLKSQIYLSPSPSSRAAADCFRDREAIFCG
ncbi:MULTISPECIES: restriction endonuclease subunit S [Thermodesulfovibrio]|nr:MULTISPECIES: restriction endonuclease subunit S [Thermodesulfovibrio]MDI6864979.1 restriction endonuclease subunit S [Thermodesulfovibrio yellowstonii]